LIQAHSTRQRYVRTPVPGAELTARIGTANAGDLLLESQQVDGRNDLPDQDHLTAAGAENHQRADPYG
jgi:hypothetical protein